NPRSYHQTHSRFTSNEVADNVSDSNSQLRPTGSLALRRCAASEARGGRSSHSHVDGAQSELIVNSDHGAQSNPDAIREVERILKTYPESRNHETQPKPRKSGLTSRTQSKKRL